MTSDLGDKRKGLDMNVEFLFCHEDKTWHTEVLAVPRSVCENGAEFPEEEITAWLRLTVMDKPQHKDVVFGTIYNMEP